MTESKFAEFQAQDRRLCILLALERAQGYSAPHPLLKTFLDSVAHFVSNDCLMADLNWLAENELLQIEKYPDLVLAKATQKGVDVAQGRLIVKGVKRPEAGM